MRKITIICVGNLKEKYWVDAVAEYKKRLSRFFDLNIIEISESKITDKVNTSNINHALELEAQKIIQSAQNKIVFPLCIEGKELDSIAFSNLIADTTDNGEMCFIIGSSHGLHNTVKGLGKPLSFGKCTLPHQLMRVVLLEQIYRAGTIMNNIEYHK